MSYTFLSFPLSKETPGYGGKTNFTSKSVKSMCSGDSCNQTVLEFDTHLGTHIDAPRHFSESGKTLDEYEPSFWISKNPHILDVNSMPGEIIELSQFKDEISQECDFLIIRTGFEKYRHKEIFWSSNPGFSPESADFLRDWCKEIKYIGFDSISLTSYQHREVGKLAHKAFLDDDHPILIIEDMKVKHLSSKLKSVVISPLIFSGADGSPVTVIGELNQ